MKSTGYIAKILATGLIIISTCFLSGCSTEASRVVPNLGSERIQIGNQNPGGKYFWLGPVDVAHGNGCGGFGRKGNYDGAYQMLKNKGVEMGATYIWMWKSVSGLNHPGCDDNRYIIYGYAYKPIAGN